MARLERESKWILCMDRSELRTDPKESQNESSVLTECDNRINKKSSGRGLVVTWQCNETTTENTVWRVPQLRLECAQERHCRYRSLRPNFHPVDFHSFVGVARKSTVTPPLQLKRRLDKRLVKYSKLVHCNGKEPDKKKQFRQSR